jgi:lactate dehydrogenase-like 2-hydroxyacid dehydrogenase
MRTTQGQGAFGRNVQTIITYQKNVNALGIGTVGRAFAMRAERIYFGVHTPTNYFLDKILLFEFP